MNFFKKFTNYIILETELFHFQFEQILRFWNFKLLTTLFYFNFWNFLKFYYFSFFWKFIETLFFENIFLIFLNLWSILIILVANNHRLGAGISRAGFFVGAGAIKNTKHRQLRTSEKTISIFLKKLKNVS